MDTNDTPDVVVEAKDTEAETTKETTSEKPVETPQQKKARLERQLARLKKDLGEEDEEPKPKSKTKEEESSDLDYGQKAFLKASGIKGADEMQLAKDFAKRTGLDLDAVVEDEIFIARLEKLRTSKANEDAIDIRGNRSGNAVSSQRTVEYWLAKGEHPPKELGRELAEKYVDARRAQGKSTKIFYND